jgi:hypothetical protein
VQVVVLNSTNVVLTILPSDPTSRQANGGAAVAAEGYFSHESKRFVRPRNYISAVSFPRASSKLGHVWIHTVQIVIVDDDYDDPGEFWDVVCRSRENHVDASFVSSPYGQIYFRGLVNEMA